MLWIYILHCNNNSYYTGYTHDLEKCYLAHANGTAKCKYTQALNPYASIRFMSDLYKIPLFELN
ncbi:MAG: GIY-YIG nuclease family protein [Legionellales bacterium]